MSRGNGVYCIEDTGELFGGNCKIVVMLDPQRRNNSRVQRDLLIRNEEEQARRLDGRSLFFSTDIKMPGKELIKTYFQKDHIEKAFRYLRGNACVGAQLIDFQKICFMRNYLEFNRYALPCC